MSTEKSGGNMNAQGLHERWIEVIRESFQAVLDSNSRCLAEKLHDSEEYRNALLHYTRREVACKEMIEWIEFKTGAKILDRRAKEVYQKEEVAA